MLRISKIADSAFSATLRPEGRIVSEWVTPLYAVILELLNEKKAVVLDFSEVRYVDNSGIRMLRELENRNVQIVNCPCFIEGLLKRDN